MKHLCVLIFSLALMLGPKGMTQDSVSLPDDLIAEPGDVVNIPVWVDLGNTGNVCGIHLNIQFDDQVLSFIGETNVHPLVANVDVKLVGGGEVVDIYWFDWFFTGISAGDGIDVLLELEFQFDGGESALEFVGPGWPNPSSLLDCTGAIAEINTQFTNGFIGEAVAVPLANWPIYLSAVLMAVLLAVFAYRRVF